MNPDLLVNAIRRDRLGSLVRNQPLRERPLLPDLSGQPVVEGAPMLATIAPAYAPFHEDWTTTFSGGGTNEVVDVLVCCNEVNERHGTGILIKRMFADENSVVSVRANDHYEGDQQWGRVQAVAPSSAQDRAGLTRWAVQLTQHYNIGRIFCVPYGEREVRLAIALHDATGAPFCLYIMDDHNVREAGISDALMKEAVQKASVRLAISSDLRDYYEIKYSERFWIAPPTIMHRQSRPASPVPNTAVVIGNIWGKSWLERLRDTVRATGLNVTWFCNNPNAPWLGDAIDDLEADGITIRPAVPEPELLDLLGNYELAILPSSPSIDGAENVGVAALSLPSRVPFILGASETPIVVLGDPKTCAARFVSFFGVGASCTYEPEALASAINMIRSEDWRREHITRLHSLRQALDCSDLPNWFRTTLDSGRPINMQFESLEVTPKLVVPQHIDETPDLGLWLKHMNALRQSMGRLRADGFIPSYIVDVGASNGIWSSIVAEVFPATHFVQVEPLRSRYDASAIEHYLSKLASYDVVVAAVGDAPGNFVLHVDEHLYGASLLEAGASTKGPLERVEVPVRTLDEIARELKLTGDAIVKLDIQGAEIKALEGAKELLKSSIQVLLLEVTIEPTSPDIPSVLSVTQYLDQLGFVYYDDAGEWRDPKTGVLLQKDIMYVRRDHHLASQRRARN